MRLLQKICCRASSAVMSSITLPHQRHVRTSLNRSTSNNTTERNEVGYSYSMKLFVGAVGSNGKGSHEF